MTDVFSSCTFGDFDMKTLFLTSRALVFRARPEAK